MIKTFNEFTNEASFTSPVLDAPPQRDIVFTKKSFEQYNKLGMDGDKKMRQKVSKLIEQTTRDPFVGSKSESLHKSNKWSKRIDEKNRLVYLVTNTEIKVLSCMGHYDDK